ncbi:hypothetical protein NHJ13051_001980 [Beauveria bassiana]
MAQIKIQFTAKLNSPDDWDAWDRDFRNQAQLAQVWDLVDPDGTATLSMPIIDYTPAGGPRTETETVVLEETPDPEVLNERLRPRKTPAPEETEASSSSSRKAGKQPARPDSPAAGQAGQQAPASTPHYAEMQFILNEHNRQMALYSLRMAVLSAFRIAFARSLHKDYVYAVQDGDVRDWYRELVESVKPPEQETWKNQIDHMQALLTAQKFKNTMVSEWTRDVPQRGRAAGKKGSTRERRT